MCQRMKENCKVDLSPPSQFQGHDIGLLKDDMNFSCCYRPFKLNKVRVLRRRVSPSPPLVILKLPSYLQSDDPGFMGSIDSYAFFSTTRNGFTYKDIKSLSERNNLFLFLQLRIQAASPACRDLFNLFSC